MKISLTGLLALFISAGVTAQEKRELSIKDTVKAIEVQEIVVSATKTERDAASISLPVSIIGREQIFRQGAFRLNEVLEEQTGLAIVNDHGIGIQMQGFDPAYTLILIDGEPVIGRTAGTMELTRFTVGNIERIEIVKGPSSALFGSEALGGVINIITREPKDSNRYSFGARYGRFNAMDLNGSISSTIGIAAISIFANRNSSNGFDLTPESMSTTAPQFSNYTINPKLCLSFNDRTRLTASGRILTESLSGISESGSRRLNAIQSTLDWNLATNLNYKISPDFNTHLRMYASGYNNEFSDSFEDDGSVFFSGNFNQRMSKGEWQSDWVSGTNNTLTAGAGAILESVAADRIAQGSQAMQTYFIYMQDEFIPESWVTVTASFRFDRNSDFGSQLSPRLSLLLKPHESLSLRGALGTGFKAPTFQQLYLDFTNAAVGYSVYGSRNALQSLRDLQERGEVIGFLLPIDQLQSIAAERSLAFNIGGEIQHSLAKLKLNIFRNAISDLIDTQPVATRIGGGNIFTYFNLNRVVTEGLECELSLALGDGFEITGGYQYLNAFDQEIVDKIREGKLGRTEGTVINPVFIPLQMNDYGGLFGRSRHLLNLKVNYDHREFNFRASVRGVYRSRYGFSDLNGNLILDQDAEYAPGFTTWDITLTKGVGNGIVIQAGMDNILNQTDVRFTPFLPGRNWFFGIRYENF